MNSKSKGFNEHEIKVLCVHFFILRVNYEGVLLERPERRKKYDIIYVMHDFHVLISHLNITVSEPV